MNTERWQSAVAMAARKHRHQLRKDGQTPYISHVVRVALLVRGEFGCTDINTLVAALLHDTIEDTTTDYDEIAERFGEDAASLVAALTKNAALPWADREAEYDARLAKADWRARLIKLADVYDNLCDWSQAIGMRREELLDKCRRALELSEGDSHHPEVQRAHELIHAATCGRV